MVPRFRWTRGLRRQPLGLFWRFVDDGRVDPSSVVIAFDVGEQVASGLVAFRPVTLVDEFDLQRVQEALHGTLMPLCQSRAISGHLGWDWLGVEISKDLTSDVAFE